MALVAVRNKFQVVIPQKLRQKIRLKVGDMLEARLERGKMTFTPKSVVGRGMAESLPDFKEGRMFGAFRSHEELVSSIRAETAKLRSKNSPAARTMTIRYSRRFLRGYAAAPPQVRKAFDKQSGFLLENLNHPSLRAKEYDEAIHLWRTFSTRSGDIRSEW